MLKYVFKGYSQVKCKMPHLTSPVYYSPSWQWAPEPPPLASCVTEKKIFFFSWGTLGIESRALCMLSKHSTGKLCFQPSHTTFVYFVFYFQPESRLLSLRCVEFILWTRQALILWTSCLSLHTTCDDRPGSMEFQLNFLVENGSEIWM